MKAALNTKPALDANVTTYPRISIYFVTYFIFYGVKLRHHADAELTAIQRYRKAGVKFNHGIGRFSVYFQIRLSK